MSHAIVQAVLNGEPREVLKAIRNSAPTSPESLGAQAIVACFEALRGDFTFEDARAAFDAALNATTNDPELDLIILAHGVWIALQQDSPRDARACRARMGDLIEHLGGRDSVRAWTHLTDAWLAESIGDQASALDHIDGALQLDLADEAVMWFNCKLMHAHHALEAGLLNRVEQDLAEARHRLRSTRDRTDAAGPLCPPPTARSWPAAVRTLNDCVTWLTVRRHVAAAEFELAAESLDALGQQQQSRHTPLVNHWRIVLLVESGHFSQAERLLDASDTTRLDDRYLPRMRAYLQIQKGDFEAATRLVEQTFDDRPTTLPDLPAQRLLLWCDLATGRIGEARQRLSTLDPDARQPQCEFEWARLLVLEDDEAAAAARLRRYLSRATPGQVERQLKLTPEWTAYQFARLRRLADSLPDEDDEAPTPTEPTDAAEPAGKPSLDAVDKRLIGTSQAMEDVRQWIKRFAWIERFARLNTSVLITGETGTGKEVVARLLRDVSGRAGEPFTAINCGGLTDTLIESELFGHVRGAFTGATKDYPGLFISTGSGTIFLDEVNAMSPRLQSSLLRVLESGEVRPVGGSKVRRIKCRVFAAANESLELAMRDGRFRSDLYFRLSGLTIELPSLRERKEDVEPLAHHFLRGMVGERRVKMTPELLDALRHYDWPGNVRELKNEVEHLALMAGDRTQLTPDMFRKTPRPGATAAGTPPPATGSSGVFPAHPTPPPAPPQTPAAPSQPTPATPPPQGPAPSSTGAANEVAPEAIVPTIPAELMGNLRNTQVRRRVLRYLFDEYSQLTRAEIIDVLKCAPNTATRDLKTLEQEGYIRRVHTSGHLRTSYFERVE